MKEFELDPGEHVVIEARKHWFLFAIELLPFAILAILPLALPAIIKLVPATAHISIDYSTPLMRAALGTYWLLVWTGAFNSFTRYFLNAWVLTNKRVVAIKQRHYFNREVSSLMLNRVQDVTTNVRGILSSLLNIGDITVQSAGAEKEFSMRGIPRPEQMREIILKYVSEVSQHTNV